MKKRNALILLALLLAAAVLLVACSAPSKADTVELRNSGTAIQWKYTSEGEDSWRTLAALSDLTGANGQDGTDGQNGIDGQNGVNGKDGQNGASGADGKSVEIRKTATHVQWRTTGGTWQDLVSLAEITGAAGADGKDGRDGIDGKDGKDGVDGKDGKDGVDGINGKDGKDGVDGINGKDGKDGVDGINGKDGKDGVDGINGKDGKDGVDGINGTNGKDGVDGKDGVCTGYFYGTGAVTAPNDPFRFSSYELGGDLIQYQSNGASIKLQKGHTYSISLSGSMKMSSDTPFRYGAYISDNLPNSSIISGTWTDLIAPGSGEAATLCWLPFAYNRIYTPKYDTDLQYMVKTIYTNTVLSGVNYNLTILALN